MRDDIAIASSPDVYECRSKLHNAGKPVSIMVIMPGGD